MEVHYFEGWHRHYREAVGPLGEEQARARYEIGKEYAAVIGDPAQPSCFLEIRADVVGVSFLDELKREYLVHTFEEVEPGRLFLKEAIYREFGDDSEVSRGATYRFSPDGTASIESASRPFNRSTLKETKTDVSSNWEGKPDFGNYGSLIRKERVEI